MAVAKDYPTSPLAGAALFQVGKSYEDEADKLATHHAGEDRGSGQGAGPEARPTQQVQSIPATSRKRPAANASAA